MRLLLGILVLSSGYAQDLTLGERARLAVRDTVGPAALFTSAAATGIQHWRDVPPEWKQGWGPFGRRFGYHLAGNAAGNAMEVVAGALLHEDVRYVPSHGLPFWGRIHYIIARTFRVPDDRGRGMRFCFTRLIGDYGSAFLANTWYPPSANTPGEAMLRGTLSVGSDLGSNAFLEFWPDVRRWIFKR